MSVRIQVVLSLVAAVLVPLLLWCPASGCCPAPPSGKPVVNADQTVIILWDSATKTEHFVRQASFKSEADDFGFLVPSPSQPDLSESGNEAFPHLAKITAPEIQKVPRPTAPMISCGCPPASTMPANKSVVVLEEKLVAGFQAAVLEAKTAEALVGWLKEHGYAYSPEIEAWAKPYVDQGWKITAFKVAKNEDGEKDSKMVTASALRMSFKTDRPLFPYREPDPKSAAEALGAKARLLRIYFLAEARYGGELTPEVAWTGKTAWANKVSAEDRTKVLEMLKLPATTGPAEWWLTEFEDAWPYQVAPADVYFSRAADQGTVKRPPIVQYVALPVPFDVAALGIAAVITFPLVWRRMRKV